MKTSLQLAVILCFYGVTVEAQVPPIAPAPALVQPNVRSVPGGITNIQFVGDGNLQKSLNQGAPFAANTGLGVIFSRRWKDGEDRPSDGDGRIGLKHIQNIELTATINVASTADTLVGRNSATGNQTVENTRSFGNYLLLPINSRQATNVNFNVFFGAYDEGVLGKIAQVVSGMNFQFIGSNINWNLDKVNRNLTAMSYRAGIFHEFLPDNVRFVSDTDARIDYSIALGLFYSVRRIAGDLSVDTNEGLRNQILGTKETVFRGPEVSLILRLKNIKAEVAIPFLTGLQSQNPVPGLTNTQMITSISFVGGFPLSLK